MRAASWCRPRASCRRSRSGAATAASLFVADEIQSGFCRTGDWFACDHEGVVPDLVTTAKGIAGGLPLAGVTGRAELMDSVHVGGLGGTYGGNPVACAAALGAIEEMRTHDLAGRARAIGDTIAAPAASCCASAPGGRRRPRPGRDDGDRADGTGHPEPDAARDRGGVGVLPPAGVVTLTCGTGATCSGSCRRWRSPTRCSRRRSTSWRRRSTRPPDPPSTSRAGVGRLGPDGSDWEDGAGEATRRGGAGLDRLHRHPGAGDRAGPPRPVPRRRADRRRLPPRAVRAAGRRAPPGVLRAGGGGQRRGGRHGGRRGAQRHHRRGRAAADAGGPRRGDDARAGQQGEPDHRRPGRDRSRRARADRARRQRALRARPVPARRHARRRYAASCSPRAAGRSAAAPATSSPT